MPGYGGGGCSKSKPPSGSCVCNLGKNGPKKENLETRSRHADGRDYTVDAAGHDGEKSMENEPYLWPFHTAAMQRVGHTATWAPSTASRGALGCFLATFGRGTGRLVRYRGCPPSQAYATQLRAVGPCAFDQQTGSCLTSPPPVPFRPGKLGLPWNPPTLPFRGQLLDPEHV